MTVEGTPQTPPVVAVRTFTRGTTGEFLYRAVLAWCPACEELHVFRIETPDGPGPWSWDGNTDCPTFEGSMLVQSAGRRCHSFLRGGRWEFLGDCTHSLVGQTVQMTPLPDNLLT